MKIIQISDAHIAEPEPERAAHSPLGRLRKAIGLINDLHPDADVCVITGDLADDGARDSYVSLLAVLEVLKTDCRLLLGNHDRRDPFRSVFPGAPLDAGGHVQSCEELAGVQLIYLDTLDEGEDGGLLCEKRLEWFRDRLKRTPNAPFRGTSTLVFMHHPPVDVGLLPLDRIGLRNRDAFWQVIQSSGRECMVFCGHVHRNAFVRLNGTNVHLSRGLHSRIALSSTQATILLEDGPPAFSIIEAGRFGEIRVVIQEFTI